jgi:hypothetical protein
MFFFFSLIDSHHTILEPNINNCRARYTSDVSRASIKYFFSCFLFLLIIIHAVTTHCDYHCGTIYCQEKAQDSKCDHHCLKNGFVSFCLFHFHFTNNILDTNPHARNCDVGRLFGLTLTLYCFRLIEVCVYLFLLPHCSIPESLTRFVSASFSLQRCTTVTCGLFSCS